MIATAHAWSVLVGTHAVVATLALVLGAVNVLRRRRGDGPHRLIGRVWVGLMYFTAFSSFFIQQLRPGRFSWIHALSVLTIVTLSLGLWHARRGNVPRHAANMIGTYLGLLGALVGVVAVPSRLVPQAFRQDWAAMTLLTAVVVAVGLLFVAVVTRMLRRAQTPEAATTPAG
ncbi:MAG TPA: DUF2306 domain-containing protein [Segeticoccus sp.]|nr:DUF2306 domain-containing protein [Segeticoccus sp.]